MLCLFGSDDVLLCTCLYIGLHALCSCHCDEVLLCMCFSSSHEVTPGQKKKRISQPRVTVNTRGKNDVLGILERYCDIPCHCGNSTRRWRNVFQSAVVVPFTPFPPFVPGPRTYVHLVCSSRRPQLAPRSWKRASGLESRNDQVCINILTKIKSICSA